MTEALTPSTSLRPSVVLGSTTPRLWTPPLRELTPDTSYGFEAIDFAREVLGIEPDPWEEWLLVHLGELLPDGRPRFRQVLVLVARQNGKSLVGQILTLYWMFLDSVGLTMVTSTDRGYAKRFWESVKEKIEDNPVLRRRVKQIKLTIGDETIKTADSEFIFAANNGRAGRSTTLARWLCDEVREHKNRDTWDSASKAMNAVWHAQTVALSNQGDAESVVLDSLRTPAIEYIETGIGDERLGLFEWSAPDGADPADPEALAMANPNFNRRLDGQALIADAKRAVAAGGEELTGFRTEVLCQRVTLMDPAIDQAGWDSGRRLQAPNLAEHRDKLALFLDISLDGSHATLIGAAELPTGIHTEVIEAWDGFGCSKRVRSELPGIVSRVKPRALGWLPNGPAAALTADLRADRARQWPPRGVELEPITSDTASLCMGFAELVKAGEVLHPGDPLQSAHVGSAQKLRQGDRWVFVRRGTGPIDGAYATAGAVHLARTLPPPRPPLAGG